MASELVAEIGNRFQRGDAATEQTRRLAALVSQLQRHAARAGKLPSDLQAEIAGLLARFRATTITGNRWLEETTGPELATLQMRVRIQKAYGVPSRDGSPP